MSDYDFGFEPSDVPVVKKVQTALNGLGLGPLTVDGMHGPMTGAAIKKFQAQKGLSATGTIDDATLTALGIPPIGRPIAPSANPGKEGDLATALAAVDVKAEATKGAVAAAAAKGKLAGFFAKVKAALHL